MHDALNDAETILRSALDCGTPEDVSAAERNRDRLVVLLEEHRSVTTGRRAAVAAEERLSVIDARTP